MATTVRRRLLTWAAVAAVAVTFAGSLAACGSDDDGSTAAASTTTTAAPSAPIRQVDVRAPGGDREYSFDTDLTSIPAGPVHVTLRNDGAVEHQAILVRMKDGVDLAKLAAEGAKDPSGAGAIRLLDGGGGPTSVAPGASASTSQVLTPGNYLLACFIPGPDGAPHAVKGMVKPFTVTESAKPVTTLPGSTDAQLALLDFSFRAPDVLPAGGTVAVTNRGTQIHEVAAYRLEGDATAASALAAQAAGQKPPMVPAGGVAGVTPGTTARFTLPKTPGRYALYCFFPDTSGTGKPHVQLGMVGEVTIK